ncbi:hypothetical protein [Streptomyces sp. BPTC-684]|uniref:hypothetical protein n=1 Tax=Streptomyces sp. BPTC-684 TaxID=3043734 RepID=UPI0024B23BED|nr:hypothetical protein [Streptomyces sp. BPTC-684]WHM41043.1 hypothetical protein QIY60_32040 [Streptomyces sp. BPTC-684]
MLPTEPPLSLHRLVAPVPPVRVVESRTTGITDQRRPPPEGHAKLPTTVAQILLAGQNQVGNAAVARAGAVLPMPSPLPKPPSVQSP